MKKITALLLAVIMAVSLAACGGGADKGSTLVTVPATTIPSTPL